MLGNNYLLWEDDSYIIKTPFNPHIPISEGVHLVVMPKNTIGSAWQDPEIAARTFKLAARACKIMDTLDICPWFNLQSNSNWGLLPGNQTFFHVHIYGRNKTANWGKPVSLPEVKGEYKNDPMSEAQREVLTNAFRQLG